MQQRSHTSGRNVLLLGDTGVGKSTWINAFANYSHFDSLEDAVKAGGFFPIPCTFTVTDPQTQEMIIISSEGKRVAPTQIPKTGESVTQNATEYVFRNADTVINLIDTPGLLDTQDAGTSTHDRDKQHVDNIIKLLSAYQEIHAIIIMLKASEARLSESFQYTLTEIFKRLDKSACNNVIFIFTYAASSKFKTDITQPVLDRFLKDNELPIVLPPKQPTIYCFENDTVKYLAECKNKIQHDEYDEEDAERNWRRSAQSTNELLLRLFSLKPHSLLAIKSINDANNMVSMTSKLVLDTIMCIFNDVDEMNAKINEVGKMKDDIKINPKNFVPAELKHLLCITETKLVYEPLDHAKLVCESAGCAKIEEGHTIYPQVCCEDAQAYLAF